MIPEQGWNCLQRDRLAGLLSKIKAIETACFIHERNLTDFSTDGLRSVSVLAFL